jgi:2-polyprenyl-3-methyl-5-hydroxy-6-metoxy-1,4-benzoquinol methylase
MTREIEAVRDVSAFWNSRAGLGQWAGTRDVTAKQLEIEAIAAYVHDGMRVLDFGCGNGITAIELARRYHVDVLGIDFAEEMVAAAIGLAKDKELKGSVRFQTGNVQDLGSLKKFDLIYTERVLINLPDWPTQLQTLTNIVDLLSDRGMYVMCENSQDGLYKINLLRAEAGLPSITPPWHNRYLRDSELQEVKLNNAELEDIIDYSSTYYFLSRVVNAWLASQAGIEPDYDAPINQLALRLPSIGDMGQGRIWLWRKNEKSFNNSGSMNQA